MKTSLLSIAATVLLVGCAAPLVSPTGRPASSVSSASADLLVISAVYGSGVDYADVSYRVSELVHQPVVEFFARPEWLHADPTPGWNKALVIVYEYRGQRRTFSCGEGGRVSAALLIEHAQKKG